MPIVKSDRIVVDRQFEAKTIADVFLKYRSELISELRDSLIAVDRDQPGELLQSIDAKVIVKSNNISFELLMNDYWKFIDEGVDGTEKSYNSQFKFKKTGKRIPIDAMKKFIAARGISPAISAHRKSEKVVGKGKLSKKIKKGLKQINKQKQLDSFAFAIGFNLKKKGLKPTYFFSNVVNEELATRMKADITAALGKDIELNFTA